MPIVDVYDAIGKVTARRYVSNEEFVRMSAGPGDEVLSWHVVPASASPFQNGRDTNGSSTMSSSSDSRMPQSGRITIAAWEAGGGVRARPMSSVSTTDLPETGVSTTPGHLVGRWEESGAQPPSLTDSTPLPKRRRVSATSLSQSTVSHPPRSTATIEHIPMRESFVDAFTRYFQGRSHILIALDEMFDNHEKGLIDDMGFYDALFTMLYNLNAMQLMDIFKEDATFDWTDQEMKRYDRNLEQKILSATAGEDGDASRSKKRKRKRSEEFQTGDSGEDVEEWLENLSNSGGFDGYWEMLTPPSDYDSEAEQSPSPTADESSDEEERDTVPLAVSALDMSMSKPGPKRRKTSASPLKLPDNNITTPASRPITQALTRRAESVRKGMPYNKKLPSSKVTHVGWVFKEIRDILLRNDRPYICGICGADFLHPADVRSHHAGRTPGTGCWAKHGRQRGAAARWNSHPSCWADMPQMNYTQVKDGFVVLDQASWDRVEAAVQSGKDFKNAKNGLKGVRKGGKRS